MSRVSRAVRGLRWLRGGARVAADRALGTGSFPFSMTFILTHRCNFRCAYCDIPAAAGPEMTTTQFKGALDELASIGLVRASFSGGEVLLRPDALPIVAHARSLGLMTSLNCNAWLAGPRLDELARVLDLLVISLDGPERDHDRLRRRGSYRRAIEVLRGARARGLPTATISVLTPSNLHVVDEVLALADELGFYAYFQPAYESCFDLGKGVDPSLGGRLFVRLADTLRAARRQGRRVAASPGYLERLARGPRFGDCARCTAGRYWGTVLPDGRLVPCHLQAERGGAEPWPSGVEKGFAAAFRALDRPKGGPGCAISPYQETDLIFGFDSGAIAAALRRLRRDEGSP